MCIFRIDILKFQLELNIINNLHISTYDYDNQPMVTKWKCSLIYTFSINLLYTNLLVRY